MKRNDQFTKLATSQANIPYYQNWLGPWAMYEPSFKALEHSFKQLDLGKHLTEVSPNIQQELDDAPNYNSTLIDGILIVTISGPIMKQAPSFGGGCSSVLVRRILSTAMHDPSIFGAILLINSPGGTVSGTRELANTVKRFGEVKPITAYCEDLAASAAYWVASQADSIAANPTALIGSIGTYCMAVDTSGAAEKAGVKVHIVKAGEFKGAGTPGTEITDDHLDEMQRQVSGLNRFFVDAVSEGRNIEGEELDRVCDGRAHLAADAIQLKLIDEIADFEEYFESFFASVQQSSFYASSPNRFVTMADVQYYRIPEAKKQELVAAKTPYAKAIDWAEQNQTASRVDLSRMSNFTDDDFVKDCLAKNLTVLQCQKAWEERQKANTRTSYVRY